MRAEFEVETLTLERTHWWYVGRRRILERLIPYLGDTVLDVGCGSGENAVWLEKKCQDLVGLEPSTRAAPAWAIVETFPPSRPLSRRFNAVCMFDVLEHIEDDTAAVRAARDALLDGGKLILTVPCFSFLWSKHDEEAMHFRRYTRDRLVGLLEREGFEVKRATYFNTILFVPIALGKFVLSGSHMSATPSWLNRVLLFIFSIESILLPLVSLPFGVSLFIEATRKRQPDLEV